MTIHTLILECSAHDIDLSRGMHKILCEITTTLIKLHIIHHAEITMKCILTSGSSSFLSTRLNSETK